MNKLWESPITQISKFAANEYVAACGDENKVYYFTCDAEGGNLYYYPTGDGTVDGIYNGRGSAELLGDYSPCSREPNHPVEPGQRNFYDGFVDYNRNKQCDSGEEVIVWSYMTIFRRNGHATAQLDMDSWETEKS